METNYFLDIEDMEMYYGFEPIYKEGEENGQFAHRHAFLLKVKQHAHQDAGKEQTYAEYHYLHGFGNDEVGRLAGLLLHHALAGRDGS